MPTKISLSLLNDTGSSSTDNITKIDTLTGTGDPNAVITFTINGTVIGTTKADASGNYTFPPTGLADGTYTVTASEPSGSSKSLTFTLDTAAPSAVTEQLVADTGVSSTDNLTSNSALTGSGTAGDVVTLTEGGNVLGTATVGKNGTWSFTPTGLTQGTHTIAASQTDVAGNAGPATTFIFTLDSVAPTVTESLLSDTGASSTDKITSNQTLTGTAEAGSVVTLKEGSTVLGTTTADASGTWKFTPTALNQGAHTITASETDIAGNTGTASLSFTLDSVAPTATEQLLADTGVSSTDKITSNPALTGSGTTGDVVTLTEGGNVLGTATVGKNGTWSFTPTGLTQGAHTITASETDIAGNTGTAALTFTLDSVAPSVTEVLANDTGVSATDKITSDATLTGTAEANSVVTLKEGTTVLGTTTTDAAGNWKFTPTTLSQGAHTITASETDIAGNTGTTSLSFTFDSAAPKVTEVLANDTGASATDKITSDATLTGTAEANSVVTLQEGTTVLGTTTTDPSGHWTFTPTGLTQGAHTITASETDVAGNTGTTSLSFTLDSVAPAVTEVLANDTGTPGDNITYDATLSGTAGPGGVVVLTEGATTIGSVTPDATGLWSFTPTNLAEGPHTILARYTDLAGNVGTASLTFTLQHGTIITSSIGGPVNLANPLADPVLITSTGAVNATGAGVDGIDGTTIATWNITNDGTVSSAAGRGISLAGAGNVSNGPTSGTAATISGTTDAIQISGAGTVTNWGSISGITGVALLAGGSVANNASGSISASGATGSGFSVGAGVSIAHAPGSVTNDGAISGGAYGIAMAAGGSVTNTASINGGEDGVIIMGAAGGLSNSGQIIATVDDGVGFFGGGTITNAKGALIQGAGIGAGAFITGGNGTVSNSGTISTTGSTFGVLLTGGTSGTVTNDASGLISGDLAGVAFNNGEAGYLDNAGTITASGATPTTGAAAADLEAGGSVNNRTGGQISGYDFGVFITNGTATVTNSGVISSTKFAAVDLTATTTNVTVTNDAGGSISGGTSGIQLATSGTVTNSGNVGASASGGAGIYLSSGGTVINNAPGSVTGGSFGIFATGGAATVTNSGSITGPHGIGLQAGGSVTNNAGGSITGQAAGVSTTGAFATVDNAGSISATAASGAAIDIEAGGSITNHSTGTVSGASFGVFVAGGPGTVVNDGSIVGTSNIGIDLLAGGNVSNDAGASISGGGFGVAVYGSGGTVTNAGTISGTISAVHFGAGTTNNRLVVDPGAVFNGNVAGGGGTNTLELAQGVSAGSLGGIGSTFTGFGTLTVDSGANWTLTGSNTVGTVQNNGTLTVASNGILDVGQFVLGNNSVTEIAGALGSGTQIAFAGAAEAIVDTASQFGANVGQSSYTGPLFENFGTGDSIDLKDVSSAGVTWDYTSSTGLLQIASGGQPLASLIFQTSSLAGGTFLVSDDGSGHALISMSNAPPVIGVNGATTTTDEASVQPFSGFTINGASNQSGVTETVTITVGSGDADGTLSGTGLQETSPGVYTLTDTLANLAADVQGLIFAPTTHQVAPGTSVSTDFSLSVAQNCGGTSSTSNLVTTSVTATAANDAPMIGVNGATTTTDDPAIKPFSGFSITDPDNQAGVTETVTITVSGGDANGTLSGAGLQETSPGVYTLTDTLANLAADVQGLSFAPTAHQVAPGTSITTNFTLSVAQNSGGTSSTSNTATTSLTATAVNDAPVIGVNGATTTTDQAAVKPFSAFSISNPDNQTGVTETVTITVSGGDSNGTLSGAGLQETSPGVYTLTDTLANLAADVQGLSFAPTAHQVAPGTSITTDFTLSVAQKIGGTSSTSNTATTSLTATAVNDAPVIGVNGATTTTDDPPVQPFSGFRISDLDNQVGVTETVTITLDGGDANGTLSGSSKLTKAGTPGVYTLTDTLANLAADVQGLSFTPTAHQVAPGASVTTNFSLSVAQNGGDGSNATSNIATTSLTTTALNDAPVIGLNGPNATTDEATVAPFSGFSISDPDNQAGVTETVTITLDGGDTNGTLSGTGLQETSPGVYTLTDTLANLAADVQGLSFTPTVHQVVLGQSVTTNFSLSVAQDSLGTNSTSNTATTSVTATSVTARGDHTQYVISNDNGSLYTQDLVPNRDGTQILSANTPVNFTDGTGVFDPTGNAEEVARLYRAAFGRSPDLPGENYWTGLINSSTLTLDQTAMNFIASAEFQNTYGSLNSAQFVETLYQNVLGRSADPTGLAYWQSQMDNGESRSQVLLNFSDSFENKENTISTIGDKDLSEAYRLYQAAFNRTPDQPGLAYWTGQLDNGTTPLQAAQSFLASPEFQQMYGGLDAMGQVNELYENVLHRQPDPTGEAYWVGQLNNGSSLASVLLNFSDSLENRMQTAAATHDSWVFVPS
jgi:hypothetical protein